MSVSCNKTLNTKHAMSLSCVHSQDVIAQRFTQKVQNQLMNKIMDYFVVSVRDFEPNILIKGVHLTNFDEKKVGQKVDFFLMKKDIHIVNLKKQKHVYVTVLLFILYSI